MSVGSCAFDAQAISESHSGQRTQSWPLHKGALETAGEVWRRLHWAALLCSFVKVCNVYWLTCAASILHFVLVVGSRPCPLVALGTP